MSKMAVPGRPKIARDPLEILENDGTIQPSLLSKYYAPVASATVALISVAGAHWVTKRPIFSGIQNYAVFSALGAAAGKLWDDYREQYYADRDAVFRHYIQLHPEDFPPLESKLIKDVLEPWIPIR